MNEQFSQPPAIDTSWIKRAGYIGPEGTWTHQASLDLFGDQVELVPFSDGLFEAYENGCVDVACVPATTSLVGATPYLDQVLSLRSPTIIAEYPKVLSYSLMASKDASFSMIAKVVGHPVALQEGAGWLDENMPNVERESRRGSTSFVAEQKSPSIAAFGPGLGAKLYNLQILRTGIEEGLHNVTRWWVLGRRTPAPTGFDRTTLHLRVSEQNLSCVLNRFSKDDLTVLNVYQRPTCERLDTHQYVIDVAGHVLTHPALAALAEIDGLRIFGSYPRRY
ncbi:MULTISPECIES: prephenate dehydratase domain-containing protein [Mesorhizobium]|uniref:prephenate dehydratase n=1 Tax=Mesorhizobium TaxID=68287 RepID=UPI0007EDC2E7|nr:MULTISPECIES: prephenate dehydratase domain-containing protein [Mesorhizobium]PBB51976.1 prephenate dehydratase [Mesorhizobium loti]QIA25214.1 prephenate dehydratase [Mesorhizobium sp. AA22]